MAKFKVGDIIKCTFPGNTDWEAEVLRVTNDHYTLKCTAATKGNQNYIGTISSFYMIIDIDKNYELKQQPLPSISTYHKYSIGERFIDKHTKNIVEIIKQTRPTYYEIKYLSGPYIGMTYDTSDLTLDLYYTKYNGSMSFQEAVTKGLGLTEKKQCNHISALYVGFTDSFNYCKTCGVKL